MSKVSPTPPELSDEILVQAVGALRGAPTVPTVGSPALVEPPRPLRAAPAARGEGAAQPREDGSAEAERHVLQAIRALRAVPAQAPSQPHQRGAAPPRVIIGALLLAAGLLLALAAGWGLRVSQRADPPEGLVDERAPPPPQVSPPTPHLTPTHEPGSAEMRSPSPMLPQDPPQGPPLTTPKGAPHEGPQSPTSPPDDAAAPPSPSQGSPAIEDEPALAIVDDPLPSLGYRDRGREALPLFYMALYTPGGPTPTRVMGQSLSVGATIHFFASAKRAADAQLTVIYPDGRHVTLNVRVSAQPGYLSDAQGRALRFIFPQPGLYRVQLAAEAVCGEGCATMEVNVQ